MLSIASATKIEQISQATDKVQGIIDAVGDLSEIDVLTDLVLIGTFIRDEKRASGLILPQDTLKEDEFQGKVGLVLKKGPLAYGDWEDDDERGSNAKLHSWVVFAIKDTWPLQLNGVACRVVPYDKLRMRVRDPKVVF
jgi:hypothetical protein